VLDLCLVALWSCLGFCDWWNSHERKLTSAFCLFLSMGGKYVVWSLFLGWLSDGTTFTSTNFCH
jgi:hypothetical protein